MNQLLFRTPPVSGRTRYTPDRVEAGEVGGRGSDPGSGVVWGGYPTRKWGFAVLDYLTRAEVNLEIGFLWFFFKKESRRIPCPIMGGVKSDNIYNYYKLLTLC